MFLLIVLLTYALLSSSSIYLACCYLSAFVMGDEDESLGREVPNNAIIKILNLLD